MDDAVASASATGMAHRITSDCSIQLVHIPYKYRKTFTNILVAISLVPSSLSQNGCRHSEDGLGNCIRIPGAVMSHS